MLSPGRYLLGVVEILLLAGFAWLGGAVLRRWLLPRFGGAPAHLATAVLALALLIWPAELLGTFGAFDPLPYLALVGAVAVGLKTLLARVAGAGGADHPAQAPPAPDGTRAPLRPVPTAIAFLVAAVAVVHFAAGVKARLSTGMTGFDSTWYHGPFAAGFFQSGDTWSLHFIAPQFLAWFYPANGEVLHAVGMLAFGRDLLSPLLNLGWLVGCLVACWCIGRPHRVAPWSLSLGAIALSVPALADQAGEARNDIVGIFFLLAAVAIALNAPPAGGTAGGSAPEEASAVEGGSPAVTGPAGRSAITRLALVVGLAAGLAAGTKLNFLLPAGVLVVGLAAVAPDGLRRRAFAASVLAALAGGGYWYLRNLAQAGNPLPWVHHLGPIALSAPEQALGGREAHSVLSYLTNGTIWSNWFLPGLHHGLWIAWPLLLLAALTGLLLPLVPILRRRAGNTPIWRRIGPSTGVGVVAGLVGVASAVAWLVAPTSASGPEGMPRGFESGLRYLAPALILGLALLPTAPGLRAWAIRLPRVRRTFGPHSGSKGRHTARRDGRWLAGLGAALVVTAVAVGYPVQRHYLESRYRDPTFSAPGLDAAFAWAQNVSGARIATTGTRQYPLFGADLSNRVQYLGIQRPHGGFEAPQTCRRYRRLLDEGHYDYVIATRDRLEPGKPPYPPQARWTDGPGATVVLRKPPTVVFHLQGPLAPSACR